MTTYAWAVLRVTDLETNMSSKLRERMLGYATDTDKLIFMDDDGSTQHKFESQDVCENKYVQGSGSSDRLPYWTAGRVVEATPWIFATGTSGGRIGYYTADAEYIFEITDALNEDKLVKYTTTSNGAPGYAMSYAIENDGLNILNIVDVDDTGAWKVRVDSQGAPEGQRGDINFECDTFTVEGDMVVTGSFSSSYDFLSTSNSITIDFTNYYVNVDCSLGPITITLPIITQKKEFIINKIDSTNNAVTITAGAGDSIQGDSSINLTTQWDCVSLYNDDAITWYIRS